MKAEAQYLWSEVGSNPRRPLFHWSPTTKFCVESLPSPLWGNMMQARKLQPMFSSCKAISLALMFLIIKSKNVCCGHIYVSSSIKVCSQMNYSVAL